MSFITCEFEKDAPTKTLRPLRQWKEPGVYEDPDSRSFRYVIVDGYGGIKYLWFALDSCGTCNEGDLSLNVVPTGETMAVKFKERSKK